MDIKEVEEWIYQEIMAHPENAWGMVNSITRRMSDAFNDAKIEAKMPRGLQPQWVTKLGVRVGGFGWMDHVSFSMPVKSHGIMGMIITEPYNLSIEEMKRLIYFVESNNLEASVIGRSPYFFGSTLRVLIAHPDDECKHRLHVPSWSYIKKLRGRAHD